MGSMGFMANQLKEQQKMMEKGEIQSLKNEIGMLLDSEKHCRTSLAGDGGFGLPSTPIQFKKSNIDDQKSTEGLEVELYTSSQDGKKRFAKMFSASDSKFKFYGSLEILSIKLFMDKKEDKEGTDDYLESEEHEDIGTLRVTVKGLKKETSFKISLSVWMKTDSDNNTTLLSCARSSSSAPKCGTNQKFHPACGCIAKHVAIQSMTPSSFLVNPDIDNYNRVFLYSGNYAKIQSVLDSKPYLLYKPLCKICRFGYSERCKKCISRCSPYPIRGYLDKFTGGWDDVNCVCIQPPQGDFGVKEGEGEGL